MSEEVWKDVVGYEGYYQVSNQGRVKSIVSNKRKNRKDVEFILNQTRKKTGRLTVNLCVNDKRNTQFVHTLVLNAFVGPRPEGYECCHNDDDKNNNTLENLRWDTHINNIKDCFKTGKLRMGENHGSSKLTELQVCEIIKLINSKNMKQIDIARNYKISPYVISNIKKCKIWKHIDRESLIGGGAL